MLVHRDLTDLTANASIEEGLCENEAATREE